jgi:hypothetical protein
MALKTTVRFSSFPDRNDTIRSFGPLVMVVLAIIDPDQIAAYQAGEYVQITGHKEKFLNWKYGKIVKFDRVNDKGRFVVLNVDPTRALTAEELSTKTARSKKGAAALFGNPLGDFMENGSGNEVNGVLTLKGKGGRPVVPNLTQEPVQEALDTWAALTEGQMPLVAPVAAVVDPVEERQPLIPVQQDKENVQDQAGPSKRERRVSFTNRGREPVRLQDIPPRSKSLTDILRSMVAPHAYIKTVVQKVRCELDAANAAKAKAKEDVRSKERAYEAVIAEKKAQVSEANTREEIKFGADVKAFEAEHLAKVNEHKLQIEAHKRQIEELGQERLDYLMRREEETRNAVVENEQIGRQAIREFLNNMRDVRTEYLTEEDRIEMLVERLNVELDALTVEAKKYEVEP